MNVFNLAQQANEVQPKQKEIREPKQESVKSFKQKERERKERIAQVTPYAMCFTNCEPNLTSEQLEILVKHQLDVPYYFVKRNQDYVITKDGKIEQVNITEKQKQDADIIESVYFKADNYQIYDKEKHEHIQRDVKDLYKTKVGYVIFKKEVTEEILMKLRYINTKNRMIFGQKNLQSEVNIANSLFVTGTKNNSDLQKLVSYVQKTLDAFQRENHVVNLKTFYNEQDIKGYCYIEMALPLNDKCKEKLYNRIIEIPNEVKLLKCLGEKKAKKKIESIKQKQSYQKSLEKRKSGIVGGSMTMRREQQHQK